jgi:hypothetical protein
MLQSKQWGQTISFNQRLASTLQVLYPNITWLRTFSEKYSDPPTSPKSTVGSMPRNTFLRRRLLTSPSKASSEIQKSGQPSTVDAADASSDDSFRSCYSTIEGTRPTSSTMPASGATSIHGYSDDCEEMPQTSCLLFTCKPPFCQRPRIPIRAKLLLCRGHVRQSPARISGSNFGGKKPFPPANGSSTGSQRGIMSAYDRGTPRDMVHTANMGLQFGPVPSYPGLSRSRRQTLPRNNETTR